MSLSTRTLPSLFNGVSRQPAILRSSDQTEAELNTWADVADGVRKRPPTQHVAKLTGLTGTPFIHFINRDVTERYVLTVSGGTPVVWGLDGTSYNVSTATNFAYLNGPLQAVTVADYTFLVNRDVTVEMDALAADTVADPLDFAWVNRNSIGINANVVAIDFLAGGEYQYRPNAAGGVYRGELSSMEKLPDNAAQGDIYKITGSAETGFRSYYVRRNGAVWDETVKPGAQNALKSSTMPHALVRESDGTFTLRPFSWAPRRVGDDDTNPRPTFVGRKLNDVFFYQNRLAFLCDENVTFSCAGDFGNFWRNTVLDSIDSDVVDVAVTSAKVSILRDVLPFNDGVLLFADQTQFSLTNGEAGVTPTSVSIQPITSYRYNQNASPVAIGTEVYFTGEEGGSSVVWEYVRLPETESTTASDITAHVPGYLPAGLKGLVALPRGLLALTGGPKVYAYQLYWSEDRKLMSAWREWEFSGDVLAGTLVDNFVYLVVRRSDGIYLERMDLASKAKPATQPHPVHLDRLTGITGTYNPVADRTTFTLSYPPVQAKFELIRGNGSTAPHSLIDPSGYVWVNATQLTVPGNETGHTVTAGETYDWVFQFSQQFAMTPQQAPLTTGRLQLRTMTINYTDTAYFQTEVSPYGAALPPGVEEVVPAKISQFTGKVVGRADLKLNQPVYGTGSYTFSIGGESKQATVTIRNPTHVGCTIVSAEWEGFYVQRTYRQ